MSAAVLSGVLCLAWLSRIGDGCFSTFLLFCSRERDFDLNEITWLDPFYIQGVGLLRLMIIFVLSASLMNSDSLLQCFRGERKTFSSSSQVVCLCRHTGETAA